MYSTQSGLSTFPSPDNRVASIMQRPPIMKICPSLYHTYFHLQALLSTKKRAAICSPNHLLFKKELISSSLFCLSLLFLYATRRRKLPFCMSNTRNVPLLDDMNCHISYKPLYPYRPPYMPSILLSLFIMSGI